MQDMVKIMAPFCVSAVRFSIHYMEQKKPASKTRVGGIVSYQLAKTRQTSGQPAVENSMHLLRYCSMGWQNGKFCRLCSMTCIRICGKPSFTEVAWTFVLSVKREDIKLLYTYIYVWENVKFQEISCTSFSDNWLRMGIEFLLFDLILASSATSERAIVP